MHLVLYKASKIIIAQYIFILGSTICFRISHHHPVSNFDPHLILFIYYIGLLSIIYDINKKPAPNLFYRKFS